MTPQFTMPRRPGNWLIPGAIVILSLCVGGCSTVKPEQKRRPELAVTSKTNSGSEGYALLSTLAADESDVSKLKWIKHEDTEIKRLTDEIAATNRVIHKEMESWGKAGLDLKHDGLPIAESAARKAISDYKTHRILHSRGKELEVELLLSQNEALTYGSHLAVVLSRTEPDKTRAAFLVQCYRNLLALQQKVQGTFEAHYSAPSGK